MRKRVVVALAICGLAVAGLGGFGVWLARLPPGRVPAAVAVPAAETAAMLQALRPPKRARPLIAVIGINDATETTDYLTPTGILRRADVADVLLVSSTQGPVTLYPALAVEPDMTIAGFDAAHPEGADYVIVPAMSRDDDPAVMAWLKEQSAKGSIVIGVCAGAKVVAAAGLLAGRRGTTHWYSVDELLRENPGITHVPDRRFVVDRGVVTTTGITASIPMALTLIEAIAGRGKAEAVAAGIGFAHWDVGHDSAAFRLTRPFATTVLSNVLRFWQREEFDLALEPGFDAVSLALVADAWSRTYRSQVKTSAPRKAVMPDRDGIRILPDRAGPATAGAAMAVAAPGMAAPALALDRALEQIAIRYGAATAQVVAMQLEYPRAVR